MNINYSFLVICLCVLTYGECYRPVLYVPGLVDVTPGGIGTCAAIMLAHPGTECVVLQPGTAALSIVNMWAQVDWYRKQMMPFFKKYPDGINIVSYSQGTLVSRAIIETTPNHNVKTWISMAGPFNGVYGIPLTDQNLVNITINPDKGPLSLMDLTNPGNLTLSALSDIFYTDLSQDTLSGAGYWHDPTKEALFLKKSKFLPFINNLIDHPNYTEYKNNFLKLNKAVLLCGLLDDIVIPRESERGDYFDANLNIVPLKQQQIYVNDTFGMQTMDKRGNLTIVNIPGAFHLSFALNMTLIREFVIPHLD